MVARSIAWDYGCYLMGDMLDEKRSWPAPPH